MPLRAEALLFVVLEALLLSWAAGAVMGSMLTLASGIVAGVMGLSWLLKYAFVLLERAANGRFHPPAVAVEMLGPFEPRAALLLAWIGAVAFAAWHLPGRAGAVLAVLALAALPAVVAVVGAWGERWAVFDPRSLWRAARGMGWLYGVVAAVAVALAWLLARGQAALLRFAWWLCAGLALLLWFCLVGASLYMRREALGFEPEHTPERSAARARRERDDELARLLDGIYRQVQLRRYAALAPALRGWFADPQPAHIEADCRYIMEALAGWRDARALAGLAPVLAEELLRAGQGAAAVALAGDARRIDPRLQWPPQLLERLEAAGFHDKGERGEGAK